MLMCYAYNDKRCIEKHFLCHQYFVIWQTTFGFKVLMSFAVLYIWDLKLVLRKKKITYLLPTYKNSHTCVRACNILKHIETCDNLGKHFHNMTSPQNNMTSSYNTMTSSYNTMTLSHSTMTSSQNTMTMSYTSVTKQV